MIASIFMVAMDSSIVEHTHFLSMCVSSCPEPVGGKTFQGSNLSVEDCHFVMKELDISNYYQVTRLYKHR